MAWIVVAVLIAQPSAPRAAALSSAQTRILQQICSNCHARPGISVPRMGDERAWQPLRAKGLDTLVTNTVNGFGKMPPLGTCSWCSESDLRALVALMAGLPVDSEEPAQ